MPFGKATNMRVKYLRGWWLVLLFPVVSLSAATGDLRLVDAVKQQNTKVVRALLEQKVEVDVPQADGATALHWAAHWDDLETADLLIRAGANLNAANDYGVTPLSLACTNRNAAMVERLLKGEANPNVALRTGETPLMTCAQTGSVDAAKALLDHGAEVNAKESWQEQTALMMAVAGRHREVVRALIERGANVQARSKDGFTPLLFAAREGDIEVGRLLLTAGANVNDAARDGGTALLVATIRGQLGFATFLLEHGADPNAAGPGYTALHFVAGSWHTELTGPNGIAAGREEQWSLMGGLPTDKKLALVKALLAHGANPNVRLVRSPPQFGYTSARFKVSMVGATPFLLAALDDNARVMRALVAGGADPTLTTKENTTPLMVASGIGRVPAERHVTERQTTEAVQLAVELGGDITAVNNAGNTALHGAAHIRFDALIQFLVDRGAIVNVKNASGLTPLMIADGSGDSDNPGIAGGSTSDLLRKLGGQ